MNNLKDKLQKMPLHEVIKHYNKYADCNYYERIYSINELSYIINGAPDKIIDTLKYVTQSHNWLMYDGYGILRSYNNEGIKNKIDLDDIVKYMNDNDISIY